MKRVCGEYVLEIPYFERLLHDLDREESCPPKAFSNYTRHEKKVVNAPVSSMFVLVVCRDASSSAPCSKASKEFAMCARSGAVNCPTPLVSVPKKKGNMDHST